jgi:hypothetical protein
MGRYFSASINLLLHKNDNTVVCNEEIIDFQRKIAAGGSGGGVDTVHTMTLSCPAIYEHSMSTLQERALIDFNITASPRIHVVLEKSEIDDQVSMFTCAIVKVSRKLIDCMQEPYPYKLHYESSRWGYVDVLGDPIDSIDEGPLLFGVDRTFHESVDIHTYHCIRKDFSESGDVKLILEANVEDS